MKQQGFTDQFAQLFDMGVALAKSDGAYAVLVMLEGATDWKALQTRAKGEKVVVVAENPEDLEGAEEAGLFPLPLATDEASPVVDRLSQALLEAVADEFLEPGVRVVAIYSGFEAGTLDSVSVISLSEHLGRLTVRDLRKLETSVPLDTLQAVVNLAVQIGREGREGKPVGTMLVVGDHRKVLGRSHPQGFDPVKGYKKEERNLHSARVREAIKEAAQMDGAFIIAADGTVMAACHYVDAPAEGLTLSKGLGSRHWAAAAISRATKAVAVSVSQSTGTVRLFHNGEVVLRVEPLQRPINLERVRLRTARARKLTPWGPAEQERISAHLRLYGKACIARILREERHSLNFPAHILLPRGSPAMLKIWGRSSGRCDGVNRRDFIQVGALGAAGLPLPDLLRYRAQAAEREARRPKSVILYWLDGGPTHIETYDPKPAAPAEYRGPMATIDTNVPGVRLSELLVGHARQMDKVSVIRSMHHNNGDHFAAGHWMLTGYHGSSAANLDPQYPSCGSVITKIRGANRPGMPAYVAVPYAATIGLRPGYMGGAYLGVAHHPFNAGGDPNRDNYQVPNLNLPGDLTMDRVGNRKQLLGELDRLRRDVDQSGLMDGLDTFNHRAFEMITGTEARAAFDIKKEDPRIRDRYGRNTYGQSALLARRLVEAGVTFVSIHNGGWDHHSGIEKAMKSRLPSMDQSIASLIEDLDQRGMLEDTLIAVMGEFGRTPKVNGGAGRDHWGNVMSVLLGGGGLRGGQVVGASNAKGEFPAQRPIKPADVLATIYRAIGLDLHANFVNRAGRPIPINNAGTPIRELI